MITILDAENISFRALQTKHGIDLINSSDKVYIVYGKKKFVSYNAIDIISDENKGKVFIAIPEKEREENKNVADGVICKIIDDNKEHIINLITNDIELRYNAHKIHNEKDIYFYNENILKEDNIVRKGAKLINRLRYKTLSNVDINVFTKTYQDNLLLKDLRGFDKLIRIKDTNRYYRLNFTNIFKLCLLTIKGEELYYKELDIAEGSDLLNSSFLTNLEKEYFKDLFSVVVQIRLSDSTYYFRTKSDHDFIYNKKLNCSYDINGHITSFQPRCERLVDTEPLFKVTKGYATLKSDQFNRVIITNKKDEDFIIKPKLVLFNDTCLDLKVSRSNKLLLDNKNLLQIFNE